MQTQKNTTPALAGIGWDAAAAKNAGYEPVTSVFTGDELPELGRMIWQFAGCNIALVAVHGGVEIWRHSSQVCCYSQAEELKAMVHFNERGFGRKSRC